MWSVDECDQCHAWVYNIGCFGQVYLKCRYRLGFGAHFKTIRYSALDHTLLSGWTFYAGSFLSFCRANTRFHLSRTRLSSSPFSALPLLSPASPPPPPP